MWKETIKRVAVLHQESIIMCKLAFTSLGPFLITQERYGEWFRTVNNEGNVVIHPEHFEVIFALVRVKKKVAVDDDTIHHHRMTW